MADAATGRGPAVEDGVCDLRGPLVSDASSTVMAVDETWAVNHTAQSALRYWSGTLPWGSREVLAELTRSSSEADREAARQIYSLELTAFEWMSASAPVDWTDDSFKDDLRRMLHERHRWCDPDVFPRVWTWLSWLGWHEDY